eukprot:CAMPEP_0178928772 /NCGR_PEP_ID=MMETSP0786-20121207/20129_1 /TAXON_ID=186022 /ORGANISM="Thalassionema frauenfeldii, Strain CCMP 1798" /LENGTH=801 /DNA_ID=CAMNT_0020604753 /DNA_START=885 /DNA_END=3287 /DNA_ORIENTATION=+
MRRMEEASTSLSRDDFDLSSQLRLARQQKNPECYDASGFYNSFMLRMGFVNTFHEQKKQLAKGFQFFLQQSTRPAIEHGIAPSSSIFLDLREVTIRDVLRKVNHIHANCVLLLEVIHEPYRQIGTNFLAQDENRDCIMVALYNYVATDEDPKDLFPVGMRFALLTPYMKNSQDDRSKNLMLRCDNPQCIVPYDDEEYVWKRITYIVDDNPSELREKGNQAFTNGNLKSAINYYNRALEHPSIDEDKNREDKIACLSNRAEVNLREERWEEAINDAKDVLLMQKDHAKGKFRLARGLSRSDQSKEALKLSQELLSQGSQDSCSVQRFVTECTRLASEEGGTYNYDGMRKAARTTREKIPFHADFTSPLIAVGVNIQCPSGVSYRGCKALVDIQEGTLVMASKALAFRERDTSEMRVEYNTYETTMEKNSGIHLVEQIVRKVWKCPSFGKKLYSLDAGDYLEDIQPHDLNKINLPRIRAILNSNSFAQVNESHLLSLQWKKFQQTMKAGVSIPESESETDFTDLTNGSGLWLNPSMINHSCSPNCTWSQIGDHMFITTTKAIKKDEELCILYASLYDTTFEERKECFAKWVKPNVGFECACDHCQLLRTNNILRKLTAEVEKAYSQAAQIVTLQGVKMAAAAESILPSQRRRFIFDQFSHLPLRLQHTAIAKLHVLEGSVLKSQKDNLGALASYKRAAEIGYEVRGTGTFEYLTDMWRIVGAAMACDQRDLALTSLETIWNHREFQSLPSEDKRDAFKELTLKYSLPWWLDEPDFGRQKRMEKLISNVLSMQHGKKSKIPRNK